jgi:hypothetical protein
MPSFGLDMDERSEAAVRSKATAIADDLITRPAMDSRLDLTTESATRRTFVSQKLRKILTPMMEC